MGTNCLGRLEIALEHNGQARNEIVHPSMITQDSTHQPPTIIRPNSFVRPAMIGQSAMPSPAPERQSLISLVTSAVPAPCYADVHGKIICNTSMPSSIPSFLPSLSPNAGSMSLDENMIELSSANSMESTLVLGAAIIAFLATAMFCIFANKIRYDPSARKLNRA
jgi:hypothetical protein